MNNIPSDEEFAKANEIDDQISHNMHLVEMDLRKYFKRICPQDGHQIYILAEEKKVFRVYAFFKKNEDIRKYEGKGILQSLLKHLYFLLELHGRGKQEEVKINVEFDSDESVKTKYEGDYFLRLR